MIAALEARKVALLANIEDIAKHKQQLLSQQLVNIEAGTCQPLDVNGEAVFRLDTDDIVNFRAEAKDLSDKIEGFGFIDETSTYSSESYVAGPIVDGPLKVNNPFWLMIHSCDMFGKQRSKGGESVSVTFSEMTHSIGTWRTSRTVDTS